jgi:transposase-like protein
VAVVDLIAAELAAVITVTVAVMVVVNITDINQPRCNTSRCSVSIGIFFAQNSRWFSYI